MGREGRGGEGRRREREREREEGRGEGGEGRGGERRSILNFYCAHNYVFQHCLVLFSHRTKSKIQSQLTNV